MSGDPENCNIVTKKQKKVSTRKRIFEFVYILKLNLQYSYHLKLAYGLHFKHKNLKFE